MKHRSRKAARPLKVREGTEGKPCRVFISYSHQDSALVRVIVDILKDIVTPMWDANFRNGHGFHEQIKMFIAHAHVFLPVITKASSQKGWVHQEIGYATALNIPVLPVTVGADALPTEMIQFLQAVRLAEAPAQWAPQLRQQLTLEAFEHLVSDFADQEHASFQCAEDNEDRARLMVRYADEVRKLGCHGIVRQAGALSSFHIPSEAISHPVWRMRYGRIPRGPFHCRWQREERLALEKHARICGCRLVINPTIPYTEYGPEARIARLEWLLKFLTAMPINKIEVAISETLHTERNVTIVGDWFAAEAVSAAIGLGYRQTIFTRHAPSVQRKIELFDQEFAEYLRAKRWSARRSRALAIAVLRKLLRKLNRQRKQ